MLQPDKLTKLQNILAVLKEDTVSSAQLSELLAPLITTIASAVASTKTVAQKNDTIVAQVKADIQDTLIKLQAAADRHATKLEQKTDDVLNKAITALEEIQSIEVKDGYTPVKGVDYFDGLPGNPGSPDTGEQIVGKINDIPEDGPKIDASHIDNLPKEVHKHTFAVQRNITWFDENTLLVDNPDKIKIVGAGAQATVSIGMLTITIPGGGSSLTAADEPATDSGDHTTFSISQTPLANTLLVINENTGQAVPSSAYTNTTTSISFNSSQAVDDGVANLVTPTLRARYFY